MLAAVRSAFDLIPDRVNMLTVSEWAERKRSLPSALTSLPGPFRWSTTPYLREIADCLSESSDVQEIALMKGARVGYNVGIIENHMGYMIENCPGSAMFVGANKEQAQTVTELRVDRMIETSGLAGRIYSQSAKRANKKTGDAKGKKEFPGGFLLIGGPSGPFLRGTGIRYLYLDELDEWKLQIGASDKKKGVTANQGDPVALARRRTAEYPLTRKIVYGSTPLDDSTSKIKELFEEGDQCHYYVPCPKCGTMQVLRWKDETREGSDKYRIKYETDDAGRLIFDLDAEGKPMQGTGRVWYECENTACRHHWRDADKTTFLEKGEWRPSATARTPHFRSFHISSLYAPVGMQSWEDIVLEWLKIGEDQTKLRSFINTILGETWKEKGVAPSAAKAEQHREGYAAGVLPSTAKPLFVTAGVDVQADRIAVEVVAWGRDMESWSITYQELPANGTTDDIDCDAWKALRELLNADHAGIPVSRALIDARYNGSVVHQFCEEGFSDSVRAVMGYEDIRADRGARLIYRLSETRPWTRKRVDLNVSEVKIDIYNKLSRGIPEGGAPTKPIPGYCHFPNNYERHYFHMLTAEDRVWKRGPNGREYLEWVRHGRNEALDCRAYAEGCIFVWYGEMVQERVEEDPDASFEWADFWDGAVAEIGGKYFPKKG